MATIPVPGVAQVELVYSWNGQIVENVLHYQIPGTANQTDLADLGGAIITKWTTNLRPSINTLVSLIQVKVTDLTTNISPVAIVAGGLPLAGLASGAMAPNNVSCVFTKRTALRGRSQRGRLYWPGFASSVAINNVITGSLVTAIIVGLTNMLTATTSLGVWEMVVVSRYTGGNPRVSGIFTPVTNFTSDGIVDSQRRRLPGRGA